MTSLVACGPGLTEAAAFAAPPMIPYPSTTPAVVVNSISRTVCATVGLRSSAVGRAWRTLAGWDSQHRHKLIV